MDIGLTTLDESDIAKHLVVGTKSGDAMQRDGSFKR